jgi:hypothetical protein
MNQLMLLCNIAFYNKVFCWWIFWAKIIHIYCTTIVREAWENNRQLDLKSNGLHKSWVLNSKQIWYRVTGALYQPGFRNRTGWHWWKAVIIAIANYRKEWLRFLLIEILSNTHILTRCTNLMNICSKKIERAVAEMIVKYMQHTRSIY